MNGGWEYRRQDLMRYMRTSTNLLHSENDQLLRLLQLAKEIQQHLAELESRARQLRGKGGMGDLPEADVFGFAEKLADVRDVLVGIAHTHQYFFNEHLDEYVRSHKADFDRYGEAEQRYLDAEERQDEARRAEWLVAQCRRNVTELADARGSIAALQTVYKQRNQCVLRNEANLLHSLNNVHKSLEAASAFVDRYQAARGVPAAERRGWL
eukprot:TRINITY_DN27546_c0_g1_i1.p1 TRINITY_DN27546_c0_g1~~TRINITY_DN27546_c0_g1_i1.p1  ORF type:complete len:210 (+),score=51.17 TRINITY_DN27546_c0_g1_i1:103-732(+)